MVKAITHPDSHTSGSGRVTGRLEAVSAPLIAAAKAALFPAMILTLCLCMFATVAGQDRLAGPVILSFFLCCFVPWAVGLPVIGRRFAMIDVRQEAPPGEFDRAFDFGAIMFVLSMICFVLLRPLHGAPHYFWLLIAFLPLAPWLGREALAEFSEDMDDFSEAMDDASDDMPDFSEDEP